MDIKIKFNAFPYTIVILLLYMHHLNVEAINEPIVVDFIVEPFQPKIGEKVTFTAKITPESAMQHPDMKRASNYRWYFQRNRAAIWELVNIGSEMTLDFTDSQFEGFYNLSVLPKGTSYPGYRIDSRPQYISFIKELRIEFSVDDIQIRPESRETVLSLAINDTFTVKCRIYGNPTEMVIMLPKHSVCSTKSKPQEMDTYGNAVTYLDNQSVEFVELVYSGCNFQSGIHICKASNQMESLEAKFKLISALESQKTRPGSRVLVMKSKADGDNNCACLSITSIWIYFPIVITTLIF